MTSLVPRPPPFLASVSIHNNTQERKTTPAAFSLIMVGYITQQSLILLSVSAIFPVNCHAAQEEEAKIKVGPSSCTSREDWIK